MTFFDSINYTRNQFKPKNFQALSVSLISMGFGKSKLVTIFFNLYLSKRREEDNQPTLNHYVHKDGFFLRGREKLLTKIVRSGSSRETVCSMSTTATVMSDNGSDSLSTQVQSCYDEKKNYFGAYTDYGHHHHHAPPPIFNTPFYTNANATQQSWDSREFCVRNNLLIYLANCLLLAKTNRFQTRQHRRVLVHFKTQSNTSTQNRKLTNTFPLQIQ